MTSKRIMRLDGGLKGLMLNNCIHFTINTEHETNFSENMKI